MEIEKPYKKIQFVNFLESDKQEQNLLMQNHFSKIAPLYSNVRELDIEPLSFIVKKLKPFSKMKLVDVGCGDGRYSLKLAEISPSFTISCVDYNQDMLNKLNNIQHKKNMTTIKGFHGTAEDLPFEKESQHAVISFNAVHHFNLPRFIKEASRILENNGQVFIYTRLNQQNKRNIWGKCFPLFNQKENRLYNIDSFEPVLEGSSLKMDSIKFFRYRRISSLKELIRKATNHHYSTFSFYEQNEFDSALEEFKNNIRKEFSNIKRIRWVDENVMFILRKEIFN